jgi:hypothetical protein
MKWSIYMTGTALQVNLEPETASEREVCALLAKHNGTAHIHQGACIGPSMAGYLRDFGETKGLAITIKTADEQP